MKRMGSVLLVLFAVQVQAQTRFNVGAHPEYYKHQGEEHATVRLESGIYGAVVNSFIDDRQKLEGIDVVYQHYGEPCDTGRCEPLSYKVLPATKGFAKAPGYQFQPGGIAFFFQSKALEQAKEARSRHGKAYLETAYIVILRWKQGKEIRYFAAP
jgi:hypothetical protein